MSDFKILKKGEKAESLYGIENKKITELELEALLDGKRIWTDINWEYAMTIQLKDRSKKLELDKEVERLNNIIDGLEKWLIVKTNDNYKYTEYDEVLDKLNQLKGDNK